MADFSYLSTLKVEKDKTARLKLHQIMVNGRSPTLILRPATEANKPYFNALLQRAGKIQRGQGLSAGMVEDNRDDDRELFPKYIMTGWEDMVDIKDGTDLKFDRETAVDFVRALPDWLFDVVRDFAGSTSNYSEALNIEVTAKNSQRGSSGS